MRIKYERNREVLLDFCNLNYSISSFKKLIYNHFKKDDKFAVCLLDISNFKFYNYRFGYEYGDAVLTTVFYKVQQAIRDIGKVYRFGGNTLLILLKDIISENEVENVVKGILKIFDYPIDIGKEQIRISTNIGIAIYPHDSTNIEAILKYAEMALTYSKKCHNDKYKFFEQTMHHETIERGKVEGELINAIYNNEFILYYQPQVDINTMKVFGTEALLRWRHPKKGILAPSYFIDIVEQNGMINEIGKFVFHQACKELKRWHKLGFCNLCMSINVSETQFGDASFLSFIDEVLEKTQVEAKYINVEITERILINPSKSILNTLSALRNKGMKILIDDFGTKYSSLNYLYCFPIDGIKIDKSFIDRIESSEKELIITKNIVKLAHELNIEIIAEGVEQKEQLQMLKKINCEKIQGFIFGKPVAADEFINFLNKFK